MTVSAVLGFLVFIAAVAGAIYFIIQREAKRGRDIVQDVKDIVE